MISILTPLTKVLTALSLALTTVGVAQAEQTTCTELNKCGWCWLNMLSKGEDNVSLSLEYANQHSLKESGYIAKEDFPSWVAAPPGHPLRSSLPLWLRVERVSDSTVIIDKRLGEGRANSSGGTPAFNQTVQSLDPGTRYTAFAYAKYEGGATQGYTYEKPFIKICFTTFSDENNCPEGTIRRWNVVTKSVFIACAAPSGN